MIKNQYPYALAICLILFFTQCQQTADKQETNRSISPVQTSYPDTSLVAILQMDSTARLSDSLSILFSVLNPTKDTIRFTQYHTPFEGFINNFLTITDSEGKEIPYIGAMAKRMMPPPEESYCAVAPGTQDSVRFSLKKGYRIEKPGTYTIQYNGGNVSGMANGEAIRIQVTE